MRFGRMMMPDGAGDCGGKSCAGVSAAHNAARHAVEDAFRHRDFRKVRLVSRRCFRIAGEIMARMSSLVGGALSLPGAIGRRRRAIGHCRFQYTQRVAASFPDQ